MDKYEYMWVCVRNNYMPTDISRERYSYREIMGMDANRLERCLGVSKKLAEYIYEKKKTMDTEYEYDRFISSGAKAVTVYDEDYPERLKNIDMAPFAILYYGELPNDNVRTVGVVGARKCSEYGRLMAGNIAEGLAEAGVEIVSGMALGIDGIAQQTAVNAGARSYGVLGSGVDICYPRANRELYERLKTEGGVLSEYSIGCVASAANFPFRNRIISAFSDVIVVVEAKEKSGTFITVDYALSQGKEIMVVPGRATDPLSVGCNALLFQGANPAQSAEDVLRIMKELPFMGKEYKLTYMMGKDAGCDLLDKAMCEDDKGQQKIQNNTQNGDVKSGVLGNKKDTVEKINLDSSENMVYSVLDFYELSPEEISNKLNMDIVSVVNTLIGLEMKGLIKEKGKNLYVKCR